MSLHFSAFTRLDSLEGKYIIWILRHILAQMMNYSFHQPSFIPNILKKFTCPPPHPGHCSWGPPWHFEGETALSKSGTVACHRERPRDPGKIVYSLPVQSPLLVIVVYKVAFTGSATTRMISFQVGDRYIRHHIQQRTIYLCRLCSLFWWHQVFVPPRRIGAWRNWIRLWRTASELTWLRAL